MYRRERLVERTHPLDKLLAILANHAAREPNLAETDVLVHLLYVLGVERTPSAAHFKQQHAERPEIDELGVAVVVEQDFRREVFGRAAKSVGQLTGAEVGFREAKVTEGDVARCVEKDVFGFQVAG